MLPFDQQRELPEPTITLSRADAAEYCRLKESFVHSQNSGIRDRRGNSFKNEIETIIRYVDRRPEGRESRALATGLIRAGSFLCVNSQRLKSFVCRCKSSINNGFQQLGYESVKARNQANSCLASTLPSLSKNNPNLSRQWTVRTMETSKNPIAVIHSTSSARLKHEIPMTDLSKVNQIESLELTPHLAFPNFALQIERPKSAAPCVRPLLPVPILTSKSPLPIPKINNIPINSIHQSVHQPPLAKSASSIPMPSENIQPLPFLEEIEPPLQEEYFTPWGSELQTDGINFSGESSRTDSSFSSPNPTDDVSLFLSPSHESYFSLDTPNSLDLNPFDEGFTSFQESNN